MIKIDSLRPKLIPSASKMGAKIIGRRGRKLHAFRDANGSIHRLSPV